MILKRLNTHKEFFVEVQLTKLKKLNLLAHRKIFLNFHKEKRTGNIIRFKMFFYTFFGYQATAKFYF